MKKKWSNQYVRMLTCIISGVILGVLICLIAITLGFMHVRSAALSEYIVHVLGTPIFVISRAGTELTGTPNVSMMVFVGMICSMLLMLVVEVIAGIRKKRKET